MIDQAQLSRALAKAVAYKRCGNDADADTWARHLVFLLQSAGILSEAGA